MLLGLLSDTHGDVHGTARAVRMFEIFHVEQVIHCGDVGEERVIELVARWPAHFVSGNVDHAARLAEAVRTTGGTYHDRFGSLELEGRSVAFLHGDDTALLEKTVAGGWDLVCYGHTHRAEIRRQGATLVVNPGALVRTGRPSVAVVTLPSLVVTPVGL